MKLLVTGAAGFLGSHLVKELIAADHYVIGVDSLITGDMRNIHTVLGHDRFHFILHDVSYSLHVDHDLDWVMHLASPASPPKYLKNPIETLRVNSEGTFQMAELARKKSAGLLYASSSEVYGDPTVHPQAEAYFGNCETTSPRAVYAEAKRFGEALIMAYHTHHQVNTRIIRIFNVYGPGMSPADGRVISEFITRALNGQPLIINGDGTQSRSFQYVDDVLRAILMLLEVDYVSPINLGNPEEVSINALAKLIKRLTESHSPIEHVAAQVGDPQRRQPDITLATKLLGWLPIVPLSEGLRLTIPYYRTHS